MENNVISERQLYNKMLGAEILAALMTIAFLALGIMVLETEKINFSRLAVTKGLIAGVSMAAILYARPLYQSARGFRKILKREKAA